MEQLYQELFQIYKDKPSLEYEKQADIVKSKIKDKDFRFTYKSFIPYPEHKDPNFNENIYKKQEFNRNKSIFTDEDYDEVVADRCMGEFKLTPNQKFIKNFISPMTPYKSLLIYHGTGVGKCHAKDTPILMYDGSIKLVQDIKVGDKLMGDDSTPRTVLSLGSGKDMLYDVEQSHAETYRVNSSHILVFKDINDNIYEFELLKYLTLPQSSKDKLFGYSVIVDYPNKKTSCCPFQAGKDFVDTISNDILHNSVQVRMKFLIGLIKTKAILKENSIMFNIISKDLITLGRSMGFAVTYDENTTYFHKDNLSKINVKIAQIDDYYGFTLDGNHRYLMGDFTVTHNTCTAINIAEQYYDTNERQVLVILSSNIKDNFMKQIFDITKVSQCTGTKYPDMVLNRYALSNAELTS